MVQFIVKQELHIASILCRMNVGRTERPALLPLTHLKCAPPPAPVKTVSRPVVLTVGKLECLKEKRTKVQYLLAFFCAAPSPHLASPSGCFVGSGLPAPAPFLPPSPSTLISFLSVLLGGDKGGGAKGEGGGRTERRTERTTDGRLRCPSSAPSLPPPL